MSPGREVELYQAKDGWRWRVRGANSDDILSDSGEGYVRRIDALSKAAELHPSLPIVDADGQPVEDEGIM